MNDLLAALPYLAPLLAAASGEVISERAGVVGIHTEGMMLAAALAGVIAADRSGSAVVGLMSGLAAAGAVAAAFALFVLRLRQDAVVVGTAANLLVLGATGTIYRLVYGDTGRLLSVPKLSALTPLALVAMIAAAGYVLARHRVGLAIRACGEAPEAVTAAGFSVARLRFWSLIAAALFAGFGGAFLSLGIAGSFAPGMTEGRGFVAIALVAFGRWRLGLVALGAFIVGGVEAAQYRLQASAPTIPTPLLIMAPYVATLLILAVVGRGRPGRGAAPEALGRAYEETG